MKTLAIRIAELNKRADELEAANKEAAVIAKNEKKKYEPVHAPSIIYKLRRDVDALKLMQYANLPAKIDSEKDPKVKEEMETLLTRFTDPATPVLVEVKEGDSVSDLLFNKYKDVRDIANKLDAACTKAGLKIDAKANKIVRA